MSMRNAVAVVVAVTALTGPAVLLSAAPAGASAPVYAARRVSVRITGGDVIALNRCVNDARDGVINTQQNACRQVATAGNFLELDDSTVVVSARPDGHPDFSRSDVDVEVSGGTATAVNECVDDAQDGVVDSQLNACQQSASAGNLLRVTNVSIAVYQ
jgi:hypothetical protein